MAAPPRWRYQTCPVQVQSNPTTTIATPVSRRPETGSGATALSQGFQWCASAFDGCSTAGGRAGFRIVVGYSGEFSRKGPKLVLPSTFHAQSPPFVSLHSVFVCTFRLCSVFV